MNPRIYVVFFIALAHGVKWSGGCSGVTVRALSLDAEPDDGE
jgi:hypothetical protein